MAGRAKESSKIFLSYSHADQRFATDLVRELTECGFSVWDDTMVPPGSPWFREIARALKESDAIVILMSPEYFTSQWSGHEWAYAVTTPKYEGRLIPVLVRSTDDVPWILEQLSYIDATRDRKGVGRKIAEALRPSQEVSKR
jgi:hypothetical protein